MKRFILQTDKQTEEVLVIPSLRHCSNKYKLEREGINKDKDSDFVIILIFLLKIKSSSVERDEFSVVA